MKKKVIIAATVLMLATTSVVSAAAFWGKYKGYDVIRLTVDGKTVKANGTPALSLDGRTMVPISMLGDAGISYSWDQETKTVAIKKQNTQVIEDDGVNLQHVEYLKNLVDAMDLYKLLQDLGDQLKDMNSQLSYGFYGISTLNDRSSLDDSYGFLKESIDKYNGVRDYYTKLLPVLEYSQIDTSDVNSIINQYYNAIESYKLSIEGLENYWLSKSTTDFNTYLNNSTNGLNTTLSAKQKSYNSYEKYVDIISKY